MARPATISTEPKIKKKTKGQPWRKETGSLASRLPIHYYNRAID